MVPEQKESQDRIIWKKAFNYKLNFQVHLNFALTYTGLLQIIQHGFVQSVAFSVQPLLHTKFQGLG